MRREEKGEKMGREETKKKKRVAKEMLLNDMNLICLL